MKSFNLFIACLLISCIEPYPIPDRVNSSSILIADGYFNATDNVVKLKLSRGVNINAKVVNNPEENANVYIETFSGVKSILIELTPGNYEANITPDLNEKYRIVINTKGKIYSSEFVEVLQTPPMDSVSWSVETDGTSINVSTHDDINKTQYYAWNFLETWEYTSAFQSSFDYIKGGSFEYRYPPNNIYYCWQNIQSSNIHIGNSELLNTKRISELSLVKIPLGSQKLLIKYSILVNQIAIPKDYYEFLQQLKKNTESLGSLFDPQPSEINGNISEPTGEMVIGNFYASTVDQKRLTISIDDLPESHKFFKDNGTCRMDSLKMYELPDFQYTIYNLVTGIYSASGALVGFLYSTHYCTDCAFQGGTREKPAYW